ncbi:MAG: T9SS type A sorting domain-containing protein [Flavobacteriales bacterium]|nr:T9SS type A sorting domain-containing protein [Flavobacteriales bacterium]
MIQSLRALRVLLCIQLLWISAESLSAQQLSCRQSTLSVGGNSVTFDNQRSSLMIQESIGQGSVIGHGSVERFTIRQGFIQPIKSLASAIETEPLLISVYPNPFTETINIRALEERNLKVEIAVFDMSGREVLRQRRTIQSTTTISLKALAQGIYILRISDSERLFTSNIQKL